MCVVGLSPNTLAPSLYVPGRSLQSLMSIYAGGRSHASEDWLPKTNPILEVRGRGAGINLGCEK
jgi:hypothetical protein